MATWIPESASRSTAPLRLGVLAAIAREPVALAGLGMVALYAAIALTVGFLPLRDPLQVSADLLAAPTAAFPFGTDALGRDLFSRVLFGARLSMQVAVLSVAAATAAGGLLGLVSGYLGGLVDLAIGRVMDVFFAFPAILLALGIVAALGPDTRNVIIAIAVVYTPIFMRVVRGPVLALKARDFVEAARAVRATRARITFRYRVPPRGAKASLTQALRERDLVLAAVDRGAVVGLAWLIMTRALDRAAYLRLLLVSEEHQSQGLGAVLLARAERDARVSGCRHLVLLVTKTNRR